VVVGQEKLGKTTFAAAAPNVLLIPLEIGYAGVTVPKTGMLTTLAQVQDLLKEIEHYCASGAFPYKTLAIDSVTALERLIHDDVIARDPSSKNAKKTVTMESAHGGYGKAYLLANDEFSEILGSFDRLAVNYGLNVVMTCHTFSNRVADPTSGEYEVWDLLLHSPKNARTYGKREILAQWADVIGFLYEPVFIQRHEKDKMARAVTQNKGRVLALSRTPAYVAGNRLGVVGEIQLPAPPTNSWNALAQAIYTVNPAIDVFTR